MTIEAADPRPQLRQLGAVHDDGPARRAVEHELQRLFPSVPADQVEILVDCLWSHFDAAPVRDFVPLLVEKQAREELLEHVRPRADADDAVPGAGTPGPPPASGRGTSGDVRRSRRLGIRRPRW